MSITFSCDVDIPKDEIINELDSEGYTVISPDGEVLTKNNKSTVEEEIVIEFGSLGERNFIENLLKSRNLKYEIRRNNV